MQAFTQIFNQRIFFGAMNWGMGHISRSIDMLRQLENQGNHLAIACNAEQEQIMRSYFPEAEYLALDGYPFYFSQKGFSSFHFLLQTPKLRQHIALEKKWVRDILKRKPFDLILSDHRYGFRHEDIPSVFITHQCELPLPWYGQIIQRIHASYLNAFDFCWIVDSELERFAGKLSSRPKIPSYYTGPLSRFEDAVQRKKWNIMVLNGPKAFHKLLIYHFKKELSTLDYVIGRHPEIPAHIPQIVSWREADLLLSEAKCIYSFCGYSTMMDVSRLGCAWRTIPTPGQREQEYLFQQKTLREGGLI